jgi:hypothetical protein
LIRTQRNYSKDTTINALWDVHNTGNFCQKTGHFRYFSPPVFPVNHIMLTGAAGTWHKLGRRRRWPKSNAWYPAAFGVEGSAWRGGKCTQ